MGRLSIEDYPPVMTSADVAELLGHPVKQIQVMAREGRVPARRRPGAHQWLFPRDELIAWLRSDETKVVPTCDDSGPFTTARRSWPPGRAQDAIW